MKTMTLEQAKAALKLVEAEYEKSAADLRAAGEPICEGPMGVVFEQDVQSISASIAYMGKRILQRRRRLLSTKGLYSGVEVDQAFDVLDQLGISVPSGPSPPLESAAALGSSSTRLRSTATIECNIRCPHCINRYVIDTSLPAGQGHIVTDVREGDAYVTSCPLCGKENWTALSLIQQERKRNNGTG